MQDHLDRLGSWARRAGLVGSVVFSVAAGLAAAAWASQTSVISRLETAWLLGPLLLLLLPGPTVALLLSHRRRLLAERALAEGSRPEWLQAEQRRPDADDQAIELEPTPTERVLRHDTNRVTPAHAPLTPASPGRRRVDHRAEPVSDRRTDARGRRRFTAD